MSLKFGMEIYFILDQRLFSSEKSMVPAEFHAMQQKLLNNNNYKNFVRQMQFLNTIKFKAIPKILHYKKFT